MRNIALPVVAAILVAGFTVSAAAQTAPLVLPSADTPPTAAANGDFKIEWEVKNRFRLFRSEADFQRHAAAFRSDGVLGAELLAAFKGFIENPVRMLA